MATSGSALVASALTKRYPGVLALDGVDLDVRFGEVHALVGENGAGKSTFVRVLEGVHPPDSGTMTLAGEPFAPASPQDSLTAGIRVVHQELSTMPTLSVAENLFLERLPNTAGWVRRGELKKRAKDALSRVGLHVDPSRTMETLSLAQSQLVEIARALAADARIVVFDEPTTALTQPERDRLLDLIRGLRDQGLAVIYISHNLEEVFALADRTTVLRNGKAVGTRETSEFTTASLVRMMIGRELDTDQVFPDDVIPGAQVLEVSHLSVADGTVRDVSFALHKGEILGLSGLVGAGRTETVRALFGADPKKTGDITVNGRPLHCAHPRDAIHAGISLATEDRKNQGLLLTLGCDINISLASIDKVSSNGLMRKKEEKSLARQMIERMGVKAHSPGTAVGTLSGGNQQKVVLGRWILRGSDILIVDEPTRGIDVGARHEIYRHLADLAREGKSLIVVSSDLTELLQLCHRILVFSRGKIAADLDRTEFDQEKILTAAYSEYMNTEPQEREDDRVDLSR